MLLSFARNIASHGPTHSINRSNKLPGPSSGSWALIHKPGGFAAQKAAIENLSDFAIVVAATCQVRHWSEDPRMRRMGTPSGNAVRSLTCALLCEMDNAKLDEYRRAVDRLQEAVERLSGFPRDWQAANDEYQKAAQQCEKARSALHLAGDTGAFGVETL
jgi:hypothetical protein